MERALKVQKKMKSARETGDIRKAQKISDKQQWHAAFEKAQGTSMRVGVGYQGVGIDIPVRSLAQSAFNAPACLLGQGHVVA